jgi:hypothetical protein
MRAGDAEVDIGSGNLFQDRLDREIRWDVINLWQRAQSRFRWLLSRKGKRWIFCIDPAEQTSAFFRSSTDYTDTRWRRQQ